MMTSKAPAHDVPATPSDEARRTARADLAVARRYLEHGFLDAAIRLLVRNAADVTPADLRGTAFGIFSFASGLMLLAASVIAGALWDAIGPGATFLAGAGFTALSLAGIAAIMAGFRTPTAAG